MAGWNCLEATLASLTVHLLSIMTGFQSQLADKHANLLFFNALLACGMHIIDGRPGALWLSHLERGRGEQLWSSDSLAPQVGKSRSDHSLSKVPFWLPYLALLPPTRQSK